MFCNPARVSILALLAVLAGATAPGLFAQVTIGAGGFTSTNVCPYSTDSLPPGCLMVTNYNATTNSGALQLTASSGNQVGSAWAVAPQTVANGFSTSFTFQFTNPSNPPADGIAFVIQNAQLTNTSASGLAAIGYTGGNGGAIGYGGDDANNQPNAGIPNSLAIEFDTYQNGWDSNANHVAIQSCGTGYNTSHHNQNCSGGGNSTLAINYSIASTLSDGNPHTVSIQYNPPGTTPCDSTVTGNLCIYLDKTNTSNQAPVLSATVDLSTIGLVNGTAYVGFTGATGGDFETQDLQSWAFSQTVTAPLSITGPTPLVFNDTPGTQVIQVVDFTAAGQLTLPITNPQIQSTNVIVTDGVDWPPYVIGTSYSVSHIFPKTGDNPGGIGAKGSIYKDACFNATNPPADANCPFITNPNPSNFILIQDTFSLPFLPSIADGTTAALLEYSPVTTNTSDWLASASAPNPVCTSTLGASSTSPGPQACDLLDILVYIFGDDGTASGKSKGKKGQFASVYGVPEPLTTLTVNGTQLNNPPSNSNSSASLWFTSPLSLGFVVNPACPPGSATCPPTPSTDNNFYSPAPVAGESYQFTDLNFNDVYPSTTPAQAQPAPDTTHVHVVTFPGSQNQVSLPDGQYYLQYSSADNAGIVERNIKLLPSGATCTNPVSPFNTIKAPCYQTKLFYSQVNVDTTKPQITGPTLTPPPATYNGVPNAYLLNQVATGTFSCFDPPTNGVASGIASCTGPAGGIVITTATGNYYSFTVNAADVAGNVAASSVPYTVVDQPVDVDAGYLAASSVKPGSQAAYLIGVINEAKKNIAYGVTLTDTVSLPAGASISSITSYGGSCSFSANVITCKISTLAPLNTLSAAGALVVVNVPKTTTSGKITNQLKATSLNRDLDNDGSTSFSITVKN